MTAASAPGATRRMPKRPARRTSAFASASSSGRYTSRSTALTPS